jgi:phosphoglucosamine mutase
MTVFPQELVNVRGVDRYGLAGNEVIAQAVALVEAELGETGRVVLRPSGTEPMIRVMVEAADDDAAAGYAQRLAEVVKAELSD